MSSITRPAATMNDALRMLASNLQSNYKVKATLELLIDLNAPLRRLQSSSTQTTRDDQKKREERIARNFQRRKAVEAARIKDSEEKRRRQLIAIEEYKQQRLQAVRFEGSDLKENQKPIKPKTGRGNCFKRRF